MPIQSFSQNLTLKPKLSRAVLEAGGSMVVDVMICDAADESVVVATKTLVVAANGSVITGAGESVESPTQSLVDAVAEYKAEVDALIDRAGQAAKLNF